GDLKFTTTGNDIGATFDGRNTVTVPLSLQSVELAVLKPGVSINLEYDLIIQAALGRGGEIARAEFSDPFMLSGHSLLGTLRFEPAGPTAVPEPAGQAFIGAGMVGLCLSIWRRRKKTT